MTGALPEQTVFVVDDYAPICALVARHLSSMGFRVLTATSPMEAQRIVRCEIWLKIDLLLADLEMPGMRGDELADWLSHERPQSRRLFMSANRRRLRETNASMIEKPFSLNELSDAVGKALAVDGGLFSDRRGD